MTIKNVRLRKGEQLLEIPCSGGMYHISAINSQIVEVGKKLNVQLSERTLENMASAHLEKAAEMFIYLNLCLSSDEWGNKWFSFYSDLFKTKTLDVIILTLNRILKTSQTSDDIRMAKSLLIKTTTLFSLNHQKIRSLIVQGQKLNISIKGDQGFLRGMY